MKFVDVEGNTFSATKLDGPLVFNSSEGEKVAESGEWFCQPDPINGAPLWPFVRTDEQMRDFTPIED